MVVGVEHTAAQLGSGTLAVYATPALVAFMENTAMKAVGTLPEGSTTVGIALQVDHVKASGVGEVVRCDARLVREDGRKLSFEIEAHNAAGELVGRAKHDRFVVDEQRFMARV